MMWIVELVVIMVIKMMMVSFVFRCFSEILPCLDRTQR